MYYMENPQFGKKRLGRALGLVPPPSRAGLDRRPRPGGGRGLLGLATAPSARPDGPIDAGPDTGPHAISRPRTLEACGPAHRAEQARLFNACFKKRVDAASSPGATTEGPTGAR